jgi:GntR family transcriptional regulator
VSEQEFPGVAQRLALYIDRSSEEPVSRQIIDRLWLEIITGTLETGDRLPTVRQLAIHLNVRPDTVSRAYEELELLGVLITRPGQGTFVGLTSPDPTALERHAQLERLCRDVASQSEALGLPLDDVIDALVDLRNYHNDSHQMGDSA